MAYGYSGLGDAVTDPLGADTSGGIDLTGGLTPTFLIIGAVAFVAMLLISSEPSGSGGVVYKRGYSKAKKAARPKIIIRKGETKFTGSSDAPQKRRSRESESKKYARLMKKQYSLTDAEERWLEEHEG